MASIHTFTDLAATVRGRRLELDLSQQALAERAGVSRSWIARFETGRSSSEVALLMRVLDALSLELSVAPRASKVPTTGRSGAEDEVDLDAILKGLAGQ